MNAATGLRDSVLAIRKWGEPVRAYRLRRDAVAVSYDLLWHQGDPAPHAKLSAAGAWDIVITDGGDIGGHLVIP
jgi:hypothetical protein